MKAKHKLDRKTRRAIQNTIQKSITEVKDNRSRELRSASIPMTGLTVYAPFAAGASPPNIPITGVVHVSKYTSEKHTHIMAIFDKLFPHIEYTVVERSRVRSCSDRHFAFFAREDFDLFEVWMAGHREKFASDATFEDFSIPPPSDPTAVPFTFYQTNTKSVIDAWVWALENCEGHVRHAAGMWFFQHESDCALFKLAHG